MNIIKDNKGFTLIELLAVIVILAIIILIAASNIGGITTSARKNILAEEGNIMIEAAETAYQVAVLEGQVNTGNACFSMDYLYQEGFFDKGWEDGYTGSVFIESKNGGKIFDYYFWISNGSYKFSKAKLGSTGKVGTDGATASEHCDNLKGLTQFDWVTDTDGEGTPGIVVKDIPSA